MAVTDSCAGNFFGVFMETCLTQELAPGVILFITPMAAQIFRLFHLGIVLAQYFEPGAPVRERGMR